MYIGENEDVRRVRDGKKGYCGKNPAGQFAGAEEEAEIQFLSGEEEAEIQFLSNAKEFEDEAERLNDDQLPCPNAEGYCGPPPGDQFIGKEPYETAEVAEEPEEQFMGEPPPEMHFPPFMGASPESEFLGGDLLVIEGLDQATGPYEPDYRPDLVPFVTKPSTNHFAAYRQGAKYWGPGNQYEPGFQKEQRLPSTDNWHTEAFAGLGDMGLHSEVEQRRAIELAENHFRKAIDALRKGNRAIYHENLGFLRGIHRLAELEGAANVMHRVGKMIRELR